MNQPLDWNTLDEAAQWLTGHTGRQWGVRAVLDAAIHHPVGHNEAGASNLCTAIGVALPQGHVIKHAVLNVGEGRDYLEMLIKAKLLPPARQFEQVVPIYSSYWRPVALLQLEVRQLLAAGWVCVATARNWFVNALDPCRIDIIEPPFIAHLENVGIPWRMLMELAERLGTDQPADPLAAGKSAPDSETAEPTGKWALGIQRAAWDAAKAIVSGGGKLTADGLEKAMLDAGQVEFKFGEFRLKSMNGNLNDRQMKAKPKTIAEWTTAIKKLLQ